MASEPQAWLAAATRWTVEPRRAASADEHRLTFLQVALQDLGRTSVGESERDGNRLRLAVGTQDPDASGSAGVRFGARLCNDLVVTGARLALGPGQAAFTQGAALLSARLEDRIDARPLFIAQPELPSESLAGALRGGSELAAVCPCVA